MSAGEARGPEGEVALVFTDITRAASLWEFNAAAMLDAMVIHNETLRATLQLHRGYETVSLGDWNSGEGSFCMAFQQVSDAVAWCCDVQLALLEAEWPEALLEYPAAAEEWSDADDRYLLSSYNRCPATSAG
jgi:class 3 adenylate cyclase